MLRRLREDIQTVFAKDPAAKSVFEVIFCYPGLHAIWMHRIAHFLWVYGLRLLARLISHMSRFLTGVEIHPGARLGRRVFIDHGIGVVMGETTEIGDDVLIYQGAVFGGTSLAKKKRHPTLANQVTVGAGAILLGAIEIGAGSRIGAGSVVVTDVPPHAAVAGVPGRIGLGFSSKEIDQLEHSKLPDPIADALQFVIAEQSKLADRVKKLESLEGIMSQLDERIEKKKKEVEMILAGKATEILKEGSGI